MNIEWLILADSAQIVGGKLYMLGGGWDRLTVNQEFPVHQKCAVSAAIRVPWVETNQQHSLELMVTDEDASEQLARVNAQFEVGRPPGLAQGQEQRFQIAGEFNLQIPKDGRYVVNARLDGKDAEHTSFSVVPGPLLQQGHR